MRTLVDGALKTEARQFALRFCCEDCVHFDVPRGACAEGYPNAMHRSLPLEETPSLEFCKSFELA